jgi:carbon-monoxide dehydrogenase small subunit
MRIELTVNGRAVQLEVEPQEMLVDALRRAGFVSVKRGCDSALCGVCTVLLDGRPVTSCAVPAARAAGHEITTVEGVPAEVRRLGEFLVAEGADQCGFCSPGLVLTVLAMTAELDHPDDEAVRHYLAGNLCRCSGYAGQLRGIRKYREARR